MLELRPACGTCDTNLSVDAINVMICSFECTFCSDCATGLLQNTCPNCGGELVRRPVRPQGTLARYPGSGKRVFKPLTGERLQQHAALLEKFRGVAPANR